MPNNSKKYIKSPAVLWDLFKQYMVWTRENPYKEQQWVGKDGREVKKEIMRHVSFSGFEGWLCEKEIISDLGQYASNRGTRYSAYVPIITRIRKVCKGELLTAAFSGVANGNVVSRYLGLKETTDNIHTIKDYTVSLDLNA